jgi:hypothetical protein
MKKFALLAATAALISSPAFAMKMTVEFAVDGGETVVAVLDNAAKTSTVDGNAMPTTWDAATKTLCTETPDGEMCAVMENISETPAVGDTTTFTGSDGKTGTATILALEE